MFQLNFLSSSRIKTFVNTVDTINYSSNQQLYLKQKTSLILILLHIFIVIIANKPVLKCSILLLLLPEQNDTTWCCYCSKILPNNMRITIQSSSIKIRIDYKTAKYFKYLKNIKKKKPQNLRNTYNKNNNNINRGSIWFEVGVGGVGNDEWLKGSRLHSKSSNTILWRTTFSPSSASKTATTNENDCQVKYHDK